MYNRGYVSFKSVITFPSVYQLANITKPHRFSRFLGPKFAIINTTDECQALTLISPSENVKDGINVTGILRQRKTKLLVPSVG